MYPLNLEALVGEARRSGWAASVGDISQVPGELRRLGWRAVATRRSDAPITSLRVRDSAQARPRSLSAKYGRGALPLHTDGAHMQRPPDFVVLAAKSASPVGTLLSAVPNERVNDWRHGVFVVDGGASQFLATAIDSVTGRYRLDPGCMSPADSRSQAVVSCAQGLAATALVHRWKARTVLVIDNRKVLHGRMDAQADPGRTLQRIAFTAGDCDD